MLLQSINLYIIIFFSLNLFAAVFSTDYYQGHYYSCNHQAIGSLKINTIQLQRFQLQQDYGHVYPYLALDLLTTSNAPESVYPNFTIFATDVQQALFIFSNLTFDYNSLNYLPITIYYNVNYTFCTFNNSSPGKEKKGNTWEISTPFQKFYSSTGQTLQAVKDINFAYPLTQGIITGSILIEYEICQKEKLSLQEMFKNSKSYKFKQFQQHLLAIFAGKHKFLLILQ